MKRVRNPNEAPTVPHYYVILFKSRSHYVEGDERSRTNPGHGYPGGYETVEETEFWVTLNINDLGPFLLKQEQEKVPYVAFHGGRPLKLTVTTTTDVK